jgi:hypothetical protein
MKSNELIALRGDTITHPAPLCNSSQPSVVGQFEILGLFGNGPSTSLRKRINRTMEIIAIHHGLSARGNSQSINPFAKKLKRLAFS